MTAEQLIALLPMMVVTATSVVVMMFAAFVSNHRLLNCLSLLGLFVALLSLLLAVKVAPIQVTPLILIDRFALFYSGLVLTAGAVVILLSYDYFQSSEERTIRVAEYYILLMVAILGGMVLVSSSHFAAFFIGLELLGVSLYVLVAYLAPIRLGRLTSLEAGVKYLILSGVASALLLFGIALLYAEFGTLSFIELGRHWQNAEVLNGLFAAAGIGLLLAGVAFKLSLVPFHMWTPDVYEGAPAPSTAFIATVSKGAIFAFLLRFFATTGAFENQMICYALALVAIASMLGGNLLALLQTNVKRILAYSSIAHIGYLLVAFLAASTGKVEIDLVSEAISFYLVAYFVTTLGAFAVICVLSNNDGQRDVDQLTDYQGLFWRAPWLASILTAMLLSLAGIPLTVGFIGKFYVFTMGVEGLLWWLLAALIAGSAIGLYYYLRWIVQMFMQPELQRDSSTEGSVAISLPGYFALLVLAVSLFWLGVYPPPLIGLIQTITSL